MESENTQITRRELLKRGAIVGGVTLWTTPVVQVVGMGRAYAKDVSPGCIRYCIRWAVRDNADTGELTCRRASNRALPIWTNSWDKLGEPLSTGPGAVLTCPGDGVNNPGAANDIANRPGYEFVVYGSPQTGFYVSLPSDIDLADLMDEAEPWSAAVKCGAGSVKHKKSGLTMEEDPCYTDRNGNPYRRIFFDTCGNGRNIGRLELIIDWCPGPTE